MQYIPNSIERCTEIVGYDPYAFIMGTNSNLNIPQYSVPKGLKDASVDDYNNKTGKKPESKLKKGLKIFGALALGAAVIAGGVTLLKKAKISSTELFKKVQNSISNFLHADNKIEIIKNGFSKIFKRSA